MWFAIAEITNAAKTPSTVSESDSIFRRYPLRLPSRTVVAAYIGAAAAVVVSISASAIPILNVTLTSPAQIASCNLHPGSGDEIEMGIGERCKSTAFQPSLADWNSNFIVGNFDGIPPTTQTFQTAFTNWNLDQGAAAGGMWALRNGGNLDLTFTVVDTAVADADLGGINPFTINVTRNPGYMGPDIGQLVWTQGLYLSYGTRPPFPTDLDPPANTLDTYSLSQGNGDPVNPVRPFLRPCQPIPGQAPGPNNTTPATIGPSQTVPVVLAYCDPIYPFQLADAAFFDAPQAFWPDESFRAIALLSTLTFLTDAMGNIIERDITVYNGVNWGFDLSVPEPGTILLLLLPLAFLTLVRRKAYAS